MVDRLLGWDWIVSTPMLTNLRVQVRNNDLAIALAFLNKPKESCCQAVQFLQEQKRFYIIQESKLYTTTMSPFNFLKIKNVMQQMYTVSVAMHI